MASKSVSVLLAAVLVTLFVSPALSQFYGGADPYEAFAAAGNANSNQYETFDAAGRGNADQYRTFDAAGNDGSNSGEDLPNIYCYGAKDQKLCTQMVGKDTELWKDAILNAIKASIRAAKRFEQIVPMTVAELQQPEKGKIMSSCLQSYSDTMAKLRAAIVALSKPDLPGVTALLTQANHKQCADVINEERVNLPAMLRYTNHFEEVIDAALSVVNQRD